MKLARIATYGTGKVEDTKLAKVLQEVFDCRPAAIIEFLNLRQPQYKKTACYGHFGREDQNFRWEETDSANILREKLGI